MLTVQLEYINGEIWANVWQTECIARICPDSGAVVGWVLMHGLAESLMARGLSNQQMDVLNGAGCWWLAAHAAGTHDRRLGGCARP